MTKTASPNTEQPRRIGLSRPQVILLWAVLTLATIPAMAFILTTERTVSQYHTSVFERFARDAIEGGDFDRALSICSGALKTAMNRSDHWGVVFLLRAKAYAGLGKYSEALEELERSVKFWSKAYYYASDEERQEVAELGTEMGFELLESGKIDEALHAFSAAGLGSGEPVEYLYGLQENLSESDREKLWPGAPYLIVEDFENSGAHTFEKWSETQGRVLEMSGIDSNVSYTEGSSNLIELGASKGEGKSRYGLPVYIPLSERPFGIRVWVKEEQPSDIKVMLGYWFELAHVYAVTSDGPIGIVTGDWKRFDIERQFYAEQLANAEKAGYSIAGGFINKVGLDLSPGPGNRYWVDRIILYLPN